MIAEQAWRWLPSVRRQERARFGFFFALAALVSLAQTLGLVGVEALFLAREGVERLPEAFVLAAGVTVLGVLVYGALVGDVRNDRMYVAVLGLAAVGLVVGTWGVVEGRPGFLFGLFAAWFLIQAVLISHFWTFASDYFDLLASKRLTHLFMVGSSAGGIVGGLAAAGLGRWTAPEMLVVGWAAGLLATAVTVRAHRGRLVHWGLLEIDERDETSLENLRLAARFLGRSRLARHLTVSVAAMTLALFVSQYFYSGIFAARFGDAGALARFFGLYLAAANAGELVVELVLTPWLLRRLGVTGANLVHPITTLISFAVLAIEPRLAAAVLARANRELLDNAMSAPVRQLLYHAVPLRFRGRLRAFLEGVVVHGAMAVAGAVLLFQPVFDPRVLGATGLAMAALYLGVNLRIRREYLRTLVGGVREGHLDLRGVEDRFGTWEAQRLRDLWSSVSASGGPTAGRSAAQLAPLLAERGLVDELVDGLRHGESAVRCACLIALAQGRAGLPDEVLIQAAADRDVSVRRTAVRLLRVARDAEDEDDALPAPPARRPPVLLEPPLRALLGDDDAEVRAGSARALGAPGLEVLASMARSGREEEAVAALAVLPRGLAELAAQRISDPDPGIRAAALETAARMPEALSLGRDLLIRNLDHRDVRVRRAAVAALEARMVGGSGAVEAIAGMLADPGREVRQRAVAALIRLGEGGVRAALPYLRSDRAGTAEAAVEVVASEARRFRRELVAELRRRARQSWGDLLALRVLPLRGDLATRFLRAAHADSSRRNQAAAFALLGALEDPGVVRSIERALRLGSPRSRASALEVLSHLGDREAAHLLVVTLEDTPIEEKIRSVHKDVGGNLEDVDRAVDADRRALDSWIRMGADYFRKEGGGDATQREVMERLLLLREVPLFTRLGLEQLEAIDRVMQESQYLAGEVVFREGDPGGELYLMLEGRVQIVNDYGTPEESVLAVLEAPGYFGEMAVLDDRPRSATVAVVEDARLLALDGDSFKDLLLQMPEIGFEVCRELTSRVRRMDALMKSAPPNGSEAGSAAR